MGQTHDGFRKIGDAPGHIRGAKGQSCRSSGVAFRCGQEGSLAEIRTEPELLSLIDDRDSFSSRKHHAADRIFHSIHRLGTFSSLRRYRVATTLNLSARKILASPSGYGKNLSLRVYPVLQITPLPATSLEQC